MKSYVEHTSFDTVSWIVAYITEASFWMVMFISLFIVDVILKFIFMKNYKCIYALF